MSYHIKFRESLAETTGAAFKRLRSDRGLTKKSLAYAIKRDLEFIDRVEDGSHELTLVEFIAIAEVLGDPLEILASIEAAVRTAQ